MLRELGRLLKSWWQVDRVRVSPGEGRLLRLEPPCILRIGLRVLEVVQRRVGRTPSGAYVAYRCDDGHGECELQVFPVGQTQQPTVCLIDAGTSTLLPATDIEVYG